MGESLGLGKKSSGPETDNETWSWFRLQIPKPGFGRTLELASTAELQRILGAQVFKFHFTYSLNLLCISGRASVNIYDPIMGWLPDNK